MARMFAPVLLLVTIVMKFPSQAMPETTISDQVGNKSPPECPYPCLPPPISVQNCPPPPSPPSPSPPSSPEPSTQTPPPPSGGSSGYYYPPPAASVYNPPPPAASVYNPPPTGYLPYYPPPSYVNYYAPPPPDPILPYFPFYFKNPPHFSSAASLKGSLRLILMKLIFLGSLAFFNL